MDYEVNALPSVIEESIRERDREERETAGNRYWENDRKIRDRQRKWDTADGVMTNWMTIGFGIGILVFFATCISNGIDFGFKAGVACFGICTVLGLSWWIPTKMAHKPEVIEKEWASEKARLEKELEEISTRTDQEYQDYLERFEEQADQKSASFAGSELTKEVVGWLADKLKEKIDATDRREHVENLSAQISFEVAGNNISCAYGVYDFVVKRCQNLSTGVEQAALARAIASGLQSRIVADYPKDASGTAVTVDIEYKFTKSTAVACVLYKALNGNYKPVKSWEERVAQTDQEELPTSEQELSDTEDTVGTAVESAALVEDYMTQFEKDVFS